MGRCDELIAWVKSGWYILAATVLMVTQPFLTSMTRNADGKYDYFSVSTVLMSESFKFLISVCFYFRLPANGKSHRALRLRDVLLFAIPAFVYFVNNNLIFVILMYVSTTTYQVLSAMKTVFTGILFRIMLKRILSEVHITSILMLASGAAVSQFPVCACGAASSTNSSEAADSEGESVNFLGAMLTMVTGLLSAFAGVYSELLLKKDGQLHSIHLQNIMLYTWGILFNSSALFAHDRDAIQAGGFFKGYTPAVWLLVVNNALIGLAISAIFKYANNIVRIFAHTGAMVLTMFLETVFTATPFSAQLVVSVTIVGCSTFLYNREPAPRVKDSLNRGEALAKDEKDEITPHRMPKLSNGSLTAASADDEDEYRLTDRVVNKA